MNGTHSPFRPPAVHLQELLGYSIHPPFVGNADGRHPRKLLLREQARLAPAGR
jgi:hypothetical protein